MHVSVSCFGLAFGTSRVAFTMKLCCYIVLMVGSIANKVTTVRKYSVSNSARSMNTSSSYISSISPPPFALILLLLSFVLILLLHIFPFLLPFLPHFLSSYRSHPLISLSLPHIISLCSLSQSPSLTLFPIRIILFSLLLLLFILLPLALPPPLPLIPHPIPLVIFYPLFSL
ncbi:hypothetical protein RND81_12G109500 [Saponaria officinalis]|uniref:Uncharacterized protein n=1 Tax=Saponaria officinalis TaxID=3572 RepID=A0AAW1H954_SAPOF